MRTFGLVAITLTGLGLSGCSQISNAFTKPHYHAADNTAIYTDSEASLRTTPDQSYDFVDQSYASDNYSTPSYSSDGSYYSLGTEYAYASPVSGASQYSSISQYAGSGVELYNTQPSYSDPRESEFVMLNGKSETSDWRNCETMHRGYLFISEYDFTLNPGFEVCMRNKGYVMSTEYGPGSKQVLSAKTVGLRGGFPQSTSRSNASYFFP